MSKHTSRKARWTQINAKEFRSAFGVVCYRAGAWEGTVFYDLWEPSVLSDVEFFWHSHRSLTGRFKRPRNAMMAMEDRARELCRRHQDGIRIAFKE
jgi:hypothetical protein